MRWPDLALIGIGQGILIVDRAIAYRSTRRHSTLDGQIESEALQQGFIDQAAWLQSERHHADMRKQYLDMRWWALASLITSLTMALLVTR